MLIPNEHYCKNYNTDLRLWPGGDSFITKIFWNDFPKAEDSMSPENEIVIATGPGHGKLSLNLAFYHQTNHR